MYKQFFLSKPFAKWAYGVGAVIIGFVFANTYLNKLFNDWSRVFYDIMGDSAHHTAAEFNQQLWVFSFLAACYVIMGFASVFITQHYCLRWRVALTDHYLKLWCAKNKEIEGESQRIQEDTRDLAVTLESLIEQILTSVVTLAVFLPQLWMVGKEVRVEWVVDKLPWYLSFTSWIFTGQGGLVKVIVVSAIVGTVISRYVGRWLKHLYVQNQVVEAAFRRALELAVGNKPIKQLLQELSMLFVGLQSNYHRLYLHVGIYNFWRISFGQVMIILPYVLIGTMVFEGKATWGMMQQTIGIFGLVLSSFTFFIDNWKPLTQFQSIQIRLKQFETRLYAPEEVPEEKTL